MTKINRDYYKILDLEKKIKLKPTGEVGTLHGNSLCENLMTISAALFPISWEVKIHHTLW